MDMIDGDDAEKIEIGGAIVSHNHLSYLVIVMVLTFVPFLEDVVIGYNISHGACVTFSGKINVMYKYVL